MSLFYLHFICMSISHFPPRERPHPLATRGRKRQRLGQASGPPKWSLSTFLAFLVGALGSSALFHPIRPCSHFSENELRFHEAGLPSRTSHLPPCAPGAILAASPPCQGGGVGIPRPDSVGFAPRTAPEIGIGGSWERGSELPVP